MARALVISFTDLARDPRVDRQLRYLGGAFDVVAAGTAPPADTVAEYVELPPLFASRAERARFLARLALRRHERSYWRRPVIQNALDRLRDVECDVVVANELESLPLALELGRPVVFDAHEYSPLEFEDSFRWRQTWGPYVRHLTRRYIPRAAAMTTVAPGIAGRYERETGVACAVVRNTPDRAAVEPGPVGEPIRLLHHGGLDRSRRLERMIDVMAHLDDRFRLDFVLAGRGGYRDELERRAAGDPRIEFRDAVPMSGLVEFANGYDIGIYLLDPGAFNRLHALPNKFFEFVQARLAIAIGPSPEMADLVTAHDLGVVATDFSPEALAAGLSELTPERIAACKAAAHRAAGELCAERELPAFVEIVERAAGATSMPSR